VSLSVLAGERASSAMSNVAFFAHIAADAYKLLEI